MARGGPKKPSSEREKLKPVDKEMWKPKTRIGIMVKAGEITSLEQIIDMGKPVLEPEIIDVLLPDMEYVNLEVRSTQRVTDSGKRTKFRVLVVIGDSKGHVGLGVGKSEELRPAMDYAVRDAKKHVISVHMGCGSWECRCQKTHSVPRMSFGKEGSTIVKLKPAPRGLGLAASDVVKKVLGIAGVKDVWSQVLGCSNTYNVASATMKALDSINTIRPPAE